jgi:nuclear transport factor 2 (NTF2) superfamily protein
MKDKTYKIEPAVIIQSKMMFLTEIELKISLNSKIILDKVLRFNDTFEGKHDDSNFFNLTEFLQSDSKLNKYTDIIIQILKEHNVTLFTPMWNITFVREKYQGAYYTYAFYKDENQLFSQYNNTQMEDEITFFEQRLKLIKDLYEKDMKNK